MITAAILQISTANELNSEQAASFRRLEQATVPQEHEDDKQKKPTISIKHNNIIFHGDITSQSSDLLAKTLIGMDETLKVFAYDFDTVLPASRLHIQSAGGSLMSVLKIIDLIPQLGNVDTYIDGYVASAATLMSVVGRHRVMDEHGTMLIHQIRSQGIKGKYEEIEDESKNLTTMMEMIKEIYLTNTKLTSAQLDEMLANEVWLTAKECLKYGLVDEISYSNKNRYDKARKVAKRIE